MFFAEEDLESALKTHRVDLRPYDLKKTYLAMNEMLKNHDIRSTPVCVVSYSAADIRKYMGREDIMRGLSLLLTTLKPAK